MPQALAVGRDTFTGAENVFGVCSVLGLWGWAGELLSWGRFSAPRQVSPKQGVLGKDTGFPKGAWLASTVVIPSWSRCKRTLCS